jgi:NADH-quinone oxidoreductase subunit G
VSDDKIKIEIDGQPVQVRKGQMIIQAADDIGVHIPRFCYHKKLSIAANCRMCLVEVEKAPKPVPACATPVMDGMKVYTKSQLALDAQKGVMEFLLINHPLDCPICDQGGECELQDVAMGYGKGISRFVENKRVVADEDIGPLVSTDMTRCIHCTRCVRFGEEVAGMRELGATGRGENMRIGTYVKKAVASELSGNIIDLCPVGALNNKPYRYSARAWDLAQHTAVSPHDCVGSNLYLHTFNGKVKRAVPKENEAVNETWLADRDRFSCEAVNSVARIKQPMLKRDGRWHNIGWDEALQIVGERVRAAGGDEIGALLSPNTTVEEGYLLQKWLRAAGCNNIDHRLRQHDFALDEAEPVMPWLGCDIGQLEQQKAVLLIGSDLRKDQPLLSHRIRKAALRGGANVISISSRLYDFNFPVTQHVAHPAELLKQLETIDVSALKSGPALVLLGAQAFLHPHYSQIRAAAEKIARSAGAVFGCLPAGANSAGLYLAGAVPQRGPAGAAAKAGLNAGQMLEQPRKLYITFGIDPEADGWDGQATVAALKKARHVIAFASFDNAQLRDCADLILPVATFAETDGTYVNIEGRWQSWRAAVLPAGEARPGWKILRMLGSLAQQPGFEFFAIEDVRTELQNACGDLQLDNALRGGFKPAAARAAKDKNGLFRFSEVPIYGTDPLVRRSESLQATADAQIGVRARLHPDTARRLGVNEGDRIEIRQDGAAAEFLLHVDAGIAADCVCTPLGIGGTVSGPAYGAVELKRK